MQTLGSETMAVPRWTIAAFCLSCVAGTFALLYSMDTLRSVWRSDPLESVGVLIPFLCVWLALRAWKLGGWATASQTWWGYAAYVALCLLMFCRYLTMFSISVGQSWIVLPPMGILAAAYLLCMMLLFGGVVWVRAAWFPLLLACFVIPVPGVFSRMADAPLQHIGAASARQFASLLHVPLTPNSLLLMFSPKFGMFIAPGCDGIRGGIVMALAAAIACHLYRFRWYLILFYSVAGLLLGYVFNLLRLCGLVLFYKVAASHPALEARALLADSIIGALLFTFAATLFATVLHKLHRSPAHAARSVVAAKMEAPPSSRLPLLKFAAVLFFSAALGSYLLWTRTEQLNVSASARAPQLPAQVGSFARLRVWNETDLGGQVIYYWADYERPDHARVAVGMAPVLGLHDPVLCHLTRGDEPLWSGEIKTQAEDQTAAFAGALYRSYGEPVLEASTTCRGGICDQHTTVTPFSRSQSLRISFAMPQGTLMQRKGPVPLLVKVRNSEGGHAGDDPQPLMDIFRDFMASFALKEHSGMETGSPMAATL